GNDVEGSALTFFIATPPTNGTLSQLAGNAIIYVPKGNFSGQDTFTYEAWDGDATSAAASVTISVSDVVDGPGVTITQSGGSTAVEELRLYGPDHEETDSYTVLLNTQPLSDVQITINPGTQLSVTPVSLTFTPQNWSVARTVTVQAIDDQTAESNPHTGLISHSSSSLDSNYNGIAIQNVTVAIVDNDFAELSVSPRIPTIVLNELGATSDTYSV